MNKNKSSENVRKPVGFRIFSWLERDNSSKNIIYILSVLCACLVIGDLFYDRYGHFSIEKVPGFDAIYGFVMFSLIILLATILRFFVKRPEDYYGKKAIDGEDHQKENNSGSN